jgi:hypothetical protein
VALFLLTSGVVSRTGLVTLTLLGLLLVLVRVALSGAQTLMRVAHMDNASKGDVNKYDVNQDQMIRDAVAIGSVPAERERVISALVRTAKQIDEAIWIREAEIKNAKRP